MGAGPDRRPLLAGASSNEMRTTRLDNLEARHSVGEAPHQESALFLAALTFGLAMLSLLAVLALAGVVELSDLLPFFAVPLFLFLVSTSAMWRWVKGARRR